MRSMSAPQARASTNRPASGPRVQLCQSHGLELRIASCRRQGLAQGLPLQRGRRTCVQAQAIFDDDRNEKDIGDRVIASLPYMLPLLDAIPFGKFIFLQYPFVARAMAPLGPVASLYNSIPFAPLVIFLCVFNGIVNNQNLPRFVRFNAMQAVLLDVLLIIPQVLMGTLFRNPGNDPLALQAYITVNNTIFLFVAISVAYGMGASLVGQNARLPLVAEAAETQLRGPGGGGF